jgi:tocopherol cyclase
MPSLPRTIETTLHPERYHGLGKQPPFFEGWYFKLVDATRTHRYAVIPGVSLNEGGEGPHAFVQVLNGITGATAYHVYALTDFHAAPDTFDVHIGPNRFTAEAITLDMTGNPIALNGELTFHDIKPWPVTPFAPGIMGWYAWVPRMECYHGVVSFDHTIAGALRITDESVDFTGGRGYIEKDWGQAFPSGWVWMQTNHFDVPGVSLTASIAMIPWIGRTFRGFIVGLLHNGVLYRFATYTGAKTEHLAITPNDVRWTLCSRRHRLEIVAQRSEAGVLRGPSTIDMGVRVPETLKATVNVRLTLLRDRRVIFEGTGCCAGMEVGGDTARLLNG